MRLFEMMFRSPMIAAGALIVLAGCSSGPQTTDEPSQNQQQVDAKRLTPIVDCVDAPTTPGGAWVAHFGYDKGTGTGVVPVGAANNFSPGAADRGQPTIFPPGTNHDVVKVSFDGSPLTWTLGAGTATASSSSPTCQATACPASCDDGNPCTADSCDATTNFACVHTPVTDGTTCSDGNACTQADTCQAGVCTGGAPVVCTASDQCHAAGVCNPATGACSNPAAADGTACNDGNACTQADSCQAGVCTGPNPVVCAASDACHAAGVCDPMSGVCSNPTVADGTSCSDGNACNGSEVCQAGVCTAGTPVTCTASDQCHAAGVCNPSTGMCSNPPVANGTSCNDGNACTQADSCQAGVCTGGSAVTCTASDSCHAAGVCNPTTGACSNPALPNGSSCSDGNACNGAEVCQAGICTAGTPVSCTASDQCHAAGTCNPATGACSNPPVANGTACNDSNACTQTDTCQAGVCTGGNPVSCTASDQCHAAGVCNPSTGACSNPAVADGTTCSDGNACTQTDACQAGVCVGSTPVTCVASDQCHAAGVCSPTSGTCSNPAVADGTSCNDANGCTQTDTCQAGVCTGTNPVVCKASDQCHVAGTCAPATGTCSNPAAADSTTCSDSNACTQTDTCLAGACTGTNPVVCTANPGCTPGVCDPTSGSCSAQTCPVATCPSQVFSKSYDTPLFGNVALDPAGNIFITGGFATTIDLGSGPLTTNGGVDVFVGKIDPTTGQAAYAFNFGDTQDQSGVSITADAAGHFAVTGTYIGTLAFGGSAPSLSSAVDSVFVAGFDAATGAALWAKDINLGGGAILGIATDPTDNGVVVVGSSGSGASANFGSGALPSGGGKDVVVAKYNGATGALVFAKQFGGTLDQLGQAVTVDATGKIYVTGQYSGALDFGNGALPTATSAQKRIFVAGLNNTTGAGFISRSIGVAGQQQSVAVSTDAAGDIVIGGVIAGTVNFGNVTLVSAGGQDAFAAKLGPDLSTVWAVRFGDAQTQSTKGVAFNNTGDVIVTGLFQGTIDGGTTGLLTSAGGFDAFALTLDGASGAVKCSKIAGDTADQTSQRVVVNQTDDSEYLLGTYISSIDWGGGPLTTASQATFLTKLK